jgi:hypothetical protein
MLPDRLMPDASTPRRNAIAQALTGAGFIVSAGLVLAFLSLNSEALVSKGFERAFASLDLPHPPAAHRPYDGLVGSEDFWLRSAANPALIKAAVGQNITLSTAGGERRLVILDVREGGDSITHIDTARTDERVLLITCRDVQARDGGIVHLRLEAGLLAEVVDDIGTGRTL